MWRWIVARLFEKKKKGEQIRLVVHGMTCNHCEMRVKKALTDVEGVQDAEVSHTEGQAIVLVDPKRAVKVDDLIAAVEAAGYQAELPAA
jgi:copper chaperone CopZ